MRNIRFRLVLPIVFGFLAAALMAWDYENQRMVQFMGMAWDTGPPFWPYQAVFLVLSMVNTPAFVIAIPIRGLLNLQTLSLQYLVWFPVIVDWWWWIGTRIDFGVLGPRNHKHAKILSVVLTVTAVGFLYLAAGSALREIHWWIEYGGGSSPYRLPTLLRTAGPVSWCLLLAGGCLAAAVRLIQGRVPPLSENQNNHKILVILALLFALYIFAIHRWDMALNPPPNYDACAIDRLYGLGCVHGIVVDESDRPVDHIEIDLIPAHKTGDAQWYGNKAEWTDKKGRYNFNRIDSGEYFLAANGYGAPDADHPFATAYYPGAQAESTADRIVVTRSSRTNLEALRLHRLEVVTIVVNVLWSDRTHPKESNLYFGNILYPRSGGSLPQVNDGRGVVTLPKGFEYDAVASVQCDAGKIIESHESTPVQRISLVKSSTLAEITFIIPGPPCRLWKPD
jgi:hypothetical protein